MADDKPKLSDVIAGLVASMAHARTVADMEALRIAYGYRNNEFLKGLPIPRLRFQKVSVSLPIILSEVISPVVAAAAPPSEVARALIGTFGAAMRTLREQTQNRLRLQHISSDERKQAERIDRLMESFSMDPDPAPLAAKIEEAYYEAGIGNPDPHTAPSDAAIREAAAAAAVAYFSDAFKEAAYVYAQSRVAEKQDFDPDVARSWYENELSESGLVKDMMKTIFEKAQERAVARPTSPPDFRVSVNTDEIKNSGGGPDVVTRLSFVIHEEGLEWVEESKEGGGSTTRLMTE